MSLLFPLRVDETTSCQREVGAGGPGAGRKVSKDILDVQLFLTSFSKINRFLQRVPGTRHSASKVQIPVELGRLGGSECPAAVSAEGTDGFAFLKSMNE